MSNSKIGELKQILELLDLITIKDDKIKFIIDTSGHGVNYSWPTFRLENSLLVNYFAKMSIAGIINTKGMCIILFLIVIVKQTLLLQVNSNSKIM